MIITNNTRHTVTVAGVTLAPGSNVAETLDVSRYPAIAAMVDRGEIEIDETITPQVAKKGIRKANTQKIVRQIREAAGNDECVVKAAAERTRELDDFDAEVKAAIAKEKAK